MQPSKQRKSWFGAFSVLRFRRFELSPKKRRLRKGVSVADLRAISKRRLPHGVFDYIDGGSEGEYTMRRNVEAFEELVWRPKQAIYHENIDTATEVLGTYLYRLGFRYSDYGGAAAVGWLMVVGSVLLAAFYIHIMYRRMFRFE